MSDIFLKLMSNILENYMNFIMLYHFYLKEWKLKKRKSLQLIYMIKLNTKQALNHGLVLRKVHRVIKFNQNTWLKPYWYEHRPKSKSKKWFWKRFFLSWWIMLFLEKLWKMWENIEILNLLQQKEEETVWCQNQIILWKKVSQKIYWQ